MNSPLYTALQCPASGFRTARYALVLLFVLQLLGCSGAPQRSIDAYASTYGYQRAEVQGIGFTHLVYGHNYGSGGKVLHVYLEGDGSPFILRHAVASDPTPRKPVMLGLMALDSRPSIYLGRPCYHGFARAAGCDPSLWTTARYSEQVVSSMTKVLRRELEQGGFVSARLFGHSGGGTLAWLIAERIQSVTDVVTLAGNMDVAAWTKHHAYSPLSQSLDPALKQPLRKQVRQLHLLGARDEAIPPHLVRDWINRQPNAEVRRFDKYDHTCCWTESWAEVLKTMQN